MSLLSIGTKCSSCPLVDFLPFTCPHCQLAFCSNHINQHPCSSLEAEAGPSGIYKRGRKVCDYSGCDRESIQSIGGLAGGEEGERIAREVRCDQCRGSFCVVHRAQTSHSCTSPLAHEAEHSAFLQRREKGQKVIAQHFPEFAGKITPKPPPAKDVIKKKPALPERLPPSLLLASTITNDSQPEQGLKADGTEKKIKSKAVKMHELQLRKLRMGARPLDQKSSTTSSDCQRRFFEYAVAVDGNGNDAKKACEAWRDGKAAWEGKTERVWVNMEMPMGKVMDLIIAQAKASRPKTTDPDDSLGLVNLIAEPDTPRRIKKLDLSKNSGSEGGITEGSIVLVTRGDRTSE